VSGEVFRTLMDVRRPDNGEPLRPAGGTGTAVAAIDATFSAPKSVSAVWALGSPELRAAVERAHELAVDRAVAYAVSQVKMIRQRIDPVRVAHRKTKEVIATSWRHTTARAVGDRAPDPQLHSHVLLHGAARADGKVVAIDSRSWFVHRREVGAAYRTELAYEMSRLGFGIERGTGRGGRYFEIEGLHQPLLDRWSNRHHQVRAAIETRLAASGRSGLTPAEDRHLTRSTRGAKQLVTHGDLDREWARTAARVSVDVRDVERLRTNGAPPPAADAGALCEGLTEFDSTFAAREARAVALETSAGAPINEALSSLRQLRDEDQVLKLADGRGTSRLHRARERQTVSVMRRLAIDPVQRIDRRAVDREADLLQERIGLTAEQRHALDLACSDRRLVVIEGQAGTGKTTVLSAIARAHQSDGRELVVVSTAALAAERLANELDAAGVQAPAYSIAAFESALRSGRLELGPQSTVIHDEAALASTREQRTVFEAVEHAGARLIEVGDPAQSQAVGAGGLWPWLEQAAHENDAHAELTRNVRALDAEDRRDQALFRQGEHERALAGYAARGRVIHADEHAALEAGQKDRAAGKRTLVIAQTSNEHLDELNAYAQAVRYRHGELGHTELPLNGKPYGLRAGDEIQIRRSTNELRNGMHGQVRRVGSDGAVLQFGERVTGLNARQLQEAGVRLAYVQHPFPAQGLTSDTTHLIVAEHATKEGSYVGLTRAREQTTIYTELDGEELAERLGRSEPQMPSITVPLAHEQVVCEETREQAKPERGREPDRTVEPPAREWTM
jgi:conjugative relaxase-like TrwC/TraI family protein